MAAAGVGAAVPAGHAAVLAAVGGVGDAAANRIQQLAQQKRDLANQRKRVASELKNEQKKKQRIMNKAKTLDTADLVQILAVRAAAKAKPKAKGKAKAKAKGAVAGGGAAHAGGGAAAVAAVPDP
jgi:hypothetical protein